MIRAPRIKILIADDDPALVEALKVRFKKLGLEVCQAHDACIALEMAREEQPDVLVLDINMPAGDGFSVQERMHMAVDGAKTPVIYITGDKSRRLDDLAEDYGAAGIFHKPFHFHELADLVADATQSRRKAA
jgi:DNA-binding response OmpR family regulator